MKLGRLAGALFVAAALALAPASAALAAPQPTALQPTALQPSRVGAGVNDFVFDSLKVDYELSLDENGRSVLVTTETFVAVFPDTNQNRGIQRAVPTRYDGHGIDTEMLGAVTDENGNPRPTDVEFTSGDDEGGDFMVVTSRANEFLHGPQTYVIRYQQHNVTHVPDDSSAGIDEFYWDVNGTGWAQPFGEVTATLRLAPELAGALTGDAACYQGSQNSSSVCDTLDFVPDAAAGDPVLVASAQDLDRFQNLTIAIGFEPGTIVPKDTSLAASPFSWPAIIAGLAALLAAAGAVFTRIRAGRGHPGRGTIIAEYLPPRGVNVLVSGNVSGTMGRARSALLIDLAVRHKIAILEGDKGEYFLEFRDANGLDEQELAAVRGFFARDYPGGIPVGAVTAIKKVDPAAATALQAVMGAVTLGVLDEGYRVRKSPRARIGLVIAGAVLGVVAVGCGVAMAIAEVGMPAPLLCIAAGAVAFVGSMLTTGPIRPLTERGAELRDYLKGLELYIRVGEQDRLRVLQSPEGALRSQFRPASADDAGLIAAASNAQPLAVIKLYERLLPYAILFGQEKEWSRSLGNYYAEQGVQPDWWNSQNGFNVVVFAGAVSSFSSSANVSWASSSSSSSSGGSGGGGFSGGGGGGGGGGGV